MIDATAWESVRINRQSTDDHLGKAEDVLAFRRAEGDAEMPPVEKALNQLCMAFRELDGRLRRLEAIGYGQWKEAGRKQVPPGPTPAEPDPAEAEARADVIAGLIATAALPDAPEAPEASEKKEVDKA